MPSTFAYNVPPRTLFVVGADIETVFYSTFAVLIYDHLLTLPEEVQYVWWARWTITKVVFLANRYLSPAVIGMGIWDRSGFAFGLTDHSCRAWLIAEYALGHLILSLASFIMVFRLHAAWPRRSVFALLAFTWISTNVASLTTGLMTLIYQRQFIYYEETSNTCITMIPGLWKLYLPNTVSHVAFLAVLLYRALGTPRSSKSPILGIMLKDGIIYCSVVLVALLQTVVIWAFVDWTNHLPFHLMWATCASQVSRFLLSLKTIQYELPFRHHETLTADQFVHVDRESHLDFEVQLSLFHESTFGRRTINTTEELLHHEAMYHHDKVPPTPPPTPGERQLGTSSPTNGRLVCELLSSTTSI